MIKHTLNGIDYFTSELFDSFGVPHAFTSKRGGVSSGAFDSLNVSTRRCDQNGNCDNYQNTVENFRRVLALVGAEAEKSVCAHQVHGNRIIELDKSFCGMGIFKGHSNNTDGDGLYVKDAQSGIDGICIKSADCTPILFADKRHGSVCAVHSGWRGTMLDIPGEAVKIMIKNGSSTDDIICCIGPCIGVCCYEVSDEVYIHAQSTLRERNAEQLINSLFINERNTDKGKKYDFNIGRMCMELVHLSGIEYNNIDFFDICTCCSNDEKGRIFFSHRGQSGYSGTFASVISPFCPR